MYIGATEDEPLPQDYIDTNLPMLERNITRGGYRLAWVTCYMYGSCTEASESLFLQ